VDGFDKFAPYRRQAPLGLILQITSGADVLSIPAHPVRPGHAVGSSRRRR